MDWFSSQEFKGKICFKIIDYPIFTYFGSMKSLAANWSTWKMELGSTHPERELKQLFRMSLEDLFSWPASAMLTHAHELLSTDAQLELDRVLHRLKQGEPYQYIVGFAFFDDLKIAVSPAVLIPRPETEELVHWVHEHARTLPAAKIIDWCTGSGCIALALKNRNQHYQISAADVSELALKQAAINADQLHLKISLFQDDALSPKLDGVFDVVVSNPPYIPVHEKTEMAAHVTDYEPGIALFVPDQDALLFYRKIGEWSKAHLIAGGQLFFELHERYAQETKTLMENLGFVEVEVRQDLQGKERMLRCVKRH